MQGVGSLQRSRSAFLPAFYSDISSPKKVTRLLGSKYRPRLVPISTSTRNRSICLTLSAASSSSEVESGVPRGGRISKGGGVYWEKGRAKGVSPHRAFQLGKEDNEEGRGNNRQDYEMRYELGTPSSPRPLRCNLWFSV